MKELWFFLSESLVGEVSGFINDSTGPSLPSYTGKKNLWELRLTQVSPIKAPFLSEPNVGCLIVMTRAVQKRAGTI